jgi:FdhE protein
VEYNRVNNSPVEHDAKCCEHKKVNGAHMTISQRDHATLNALEEAGTRDPDLSTYYELYHTLLHALARARADISATLEMVDEEALQARLLQGLPLLSFAQLPLEEERFAQLVSTVAQVLMEHSPELAEQTVPDSPTECLDLARQRFEAGQDDKEQSKDLEELALAQVSVDLALKPYLGWAAEQVLPHVELERWKRRYCPVCGGAPDFAFLGEESGARHLVCSRCSSQWPYRRLGCPFCDTNDHTKLSYYLGEEGVYRLYVCQACRRYLKAIDLRKVGRRVLFPAERVTTVAMDVAAQEEGYR